MSLRDRIVDTLSKYPEGLTSRELGEKLDWDSGDLDASLVRMSYKDTVSKKNGKWKVN